MMRGLSRSLLVILAAPLVIHARAADPTDASAGAPVLQRFLALADSRPSDFRALRQLDAHNEHFDKSAWMDVWTEADRSGFRYRIVGEGGSDYIRSRVFRASLETERRMWADGSPARVALTPANYLFEERGAQPDGLTSLVLKPRRKDSLLIDGSIHLNPEDGDLVRLEGRLIKPPSFWTRRVNIVRWYRRVAGVRMPVALETVASVRLVGESTFRVTYEYETVNGQRVGAPLPRHQQAAR